MGDEDLDESKNPKVTFVTFFFVCLMKASLSQFSSFRPPVALLRERQREAG